MKRRSQPKAEKQRPIGLSKYARKQLASPPQKKTLPVEAKTVAPPPAVNVTVLAETLPTLEDERVVSGVVSGIQRNGCLFVMTDGAAPQRVFVPTQLLTNFLPTEITNRVHCVVTRNEHGLLATKVLRIEKPISV